MLRPGSLLGSDLAAGCNQNQQKLLALLVAAGLVLMAQFCLRQLRVSIHRLILNTPHCISLFLNALLPVTCFIVGCHNISTVTLPSETGYSSKSSSS